jgi:hypothetical protein
MPRPIQLKLALVALLVAAALIGSGPLGLYAGGTLAFAIFNVLVTPRGTFGVRMATVAATFAMLLWPLGAGALFWVAAWLLWPPAYFVTWMLRFESDRAAAAAPATEDADPSAASRARLVVVGCIAAVAIASVAYRLIVEHHLDQSAALFVGIPSILAIVVVLAVSPRSAVGVQRARPDRRVDWWLERSGDRPDSERPTDRSQCAQHLLQRRSEHVEDGLLGRHQ